MAKPKVAVSERALVQRVNRKLKAEDQKLCTARMFSDGSVLHENTDLGRHYVINLVKNFVEATHVDLEEEGRRLGVLAAWEELAS